ncbi:MAG: hypothetical protein E6J01_00880 [Chloroflexi bacterium]|nr:MAG: hypothetical protein E6J01_00880 [Chloroflexota bacterium]
MRPALGPVGPNAWTVRSSRLAVLDYPFEMLRICPTDVVSAPVERVWTLLSSDYTSWVDARLVSREPDGPTAPGQRIHLTTSELGLTFHVHFTVERVDPARHTFGVLVQLPFGLTMRDTIVCTPLGPDRTRVQFG